MRLVVIAIVVSVYSVISYGVPSYRINSPSEVAVMDRNADDSAASEVPTTEDVDTTRRIRQALIKDSALSTYAQNVKVFTFNNRVTLKGPVRTKDESDQVANNYILRKGKFQV